MDDHEDRAQREADPPGPDEERGSRHAQDKSDKKEEDAEREEAHASGSVCEADIVFGLLTG